MVIVPEQIDWSEKNWINVKWEIKQTLNGKVKLVKDDMIYFIVYYIKMSCFKY